MGFRFVRAWGIRGAPWMDRGSFMSVESSFAGTIMACQRREYASLLFDISLLLLTICR